MGKVYIGCGRCEQELSIDSPMLEGQVADELHDELLDRRVPVSMDYMRDENMRRKTVRPVSSCEKGDCPMSADDFAQVTGLVLMKLSEA